MKSRVAILLLVLSFSQSMAQEDAIQLKIDSLLALITPNMSDTAKASIYHSIGALSDNMDTTIKYASLSNPYAMKNICYYWRQLLQYWLGILFTRPFARGIRLFF